MGGRKRKSYQEQMESIKKPEEIQSFEWPTAIYARLSVENSKKDDQGESIEGQVELCRDYIEEHPYLHYSDTYVDNGWTGTNTNRPEFQRLLNDIQAGRIKALVIKDFSRFSRDYIEAGNLLENVFPAYGVRFISVADRYDSFETDGSAQSLLIPLKNLINSYYSKDISRKVSSAVHTKQLAGEHIPSMIPYGYIKSPTREYRFEPDPETAHVVTRIFQMRVDGVALNQIARTLQNEEIPSPGKLRSQRGMTKDPNYVDSRWSPAVIKQILRNPTYLGHLVFGRMPTALYLGQPDYHYEPDESKWRVLENMHEPLVTQELFDRAKELEIAGRQEWQAKSARTVEYRKANVPIFHGLLYCGTCGAAMGYHRSNYKSGKLTGSYTCPRHMRGKCQYTHSIDQERLKTIVWQSIQDQISLFYSYERVLDILDDGRTTQQQRDCQSELQSIAFQMNSKKSCRENLYEDFTEGILTPEEYIYAKKRFDDEYQQLNEQYNSLWTQILQLKRALSNRNEWLKHMWTISDASEFRPELLNAMVEKIFVYQDDSSRKRRIEIQYKYQADFEAIQFAYKELMEEGDSN